MKKIAFILIISLLCTIGLTSFAKNSEYDTEQTSISDELDLNVGSAYLMEASTGTVLYSENQFTAAAPASVTKIMTLLLVCEALEAGKFKLTDTFSVSAYAASMGGSQVFLEEGERMSVEDLIKCTVIASANDAAVALAELTAGSEAAFVKKMNERARELGLKNTSFENTTGLDDSTTKHYSCAADIATMSRELIAYDIILKYSSLWQDTIRDGEFTLTNTNRLVRYYEGCNGLKTGSTDKAGYCVSTTAKRDNMQLIAVIMGAESRDARNEAARKLLDFGFANYALYEESEKFIENVPVLSGVSDYVPVSSRAFFAVVDKAKLSSVEKVYELPEELTAPVKEGDTVGRIIYKLDGDQFGSTDIIATEAVEKIGLGELFLRILSRIVCVSE